MPDKPKKYKIVISKDALWDIKSTKKYSDGRIKRLFQALQYIFNLLCRGGSHHYGNPGLERPDVLAVDHKENAENQQIDLLQSSRFGEVFKWRDSLVGASPL